MVQVLGSVTHGETKGFSGCSTLILPEMNTITFGDES